MCKIITYDANGNRIERNLNDVVVKAERATTIGVLESGVFRSERMSLRSVREMSFDIRPFKM